jgi:cyclic dehypoxanthinyl futalosine synthase
MGEAEARAERLQACGAGGLVLFGLAECGVTGAAGVVRGLRARFAEVWIAGLSVAELVALAGAEGRAVGDVMTELRDAGWDGWEADAPATTVDGGLETWEAVHRAAHGLGLETAASMKFGAGESAEERVGFLERVRAIQAETGGFRAFVPEAAELGLKGPTAVECLKMIAVSRLMLEVVPHIEAGHAAASLKVLGTALRFGADDAGEVLVRETGVPDLAEEELRLVIRDAGFQPAARDLRYRLHYVA